MTQFELIQYGYLGLLAMMLLLGGRSVNAYIKSPRPPKYSVAIIAMYFLLAVAGGISGFFWAEKELKSAEAKKTTAAIMQSELAQARARLEASVKNLKETREQALKQSVNTGNLRDIQEMYRQQAKEVTAMIELQEKRFENEIWNITNAFSSQQNKNWMKNKT